MGVPSHIPHPSSFTPDLNVHTYCERSRPTRITVRLARPCLRRSAARRRGENLLIACWTWHEGILCEKMMLKKLVEDDSTYCIHTAWCFDWWIVVSSVLLFRSWSDNDKLCVENITCAFSFHLDVDKNGWNSVPLSCEKGHLNRTLHHLHLSC